ncbi:phosphotransferase [Phytohabitans kaempferiae]|uniref:Phosphotransferase n=1 Tax=Phytohabitans kaempferiae TaxID=1620943 RepID=A0ABV6LYP6_9ACTN
MKTLPDNPHLDHLRQQAKDLLAGLRDTDPAATLADAQASLAGQYGFRGWTDLKAEVDRVRGRADVADPELARAVAERYDLGEVTGPMRALARPDDMGRRWSLDTDRGRWHLRGLDTWWPIVDAETDTALQEAAAAAGVLLPTPVRSRDGAVVESVGGHRWRVYTWPPSGPALAAPASARVTRAVGEVLATVHGLALPVERTCPWHTTRLSGVTWAQWAARAEAGGAAWAPAMAAAAPVLTDLEALRDSHAGADGEPVLCHNTLGPANARRTRDGRLLIVGWEHAGGQPPHWELANALLDWAVEPGGGVNVAGARALVDGYRATAGEVPALSLASFRGAVTSLANYVAGEVDTALATPPGEQRRYADRVVHHVLTHLATRSTLERLLDAVTPVHR